MVELKNGETYNGHLVSCDTWMNINLREVICTSKDGDKFWRMPECYIRGSTIKYLRIPDEVIDMVKDDAQIKSRQRTEMNKGRGGQNQRNNRPGQGGGAGGGGQGGNKGPGGNFGGRGGRNQMGGNRPGGGGGIGGGMGNKNPQNKKPKT